MTEPMEVLYQYAQEHMVLSLLRQEREYGCISRCVEEREEQLRALLEVEAGQCLEKLLKEQLRLASLQEQALFQSGFRLALELTRE